MFGELVSTRVRRFLYLSSVLLLAGAVTFRILLGGNGGKTQVAREVASNVTGALVVWILGILFLSIFFARERQARETRVIDGDASAKHFSRLAGESTLWFHHGQIGRWVRENSLPALVARSKRSPAPLRMTLVLLDPTLEQVCKAHADRRNSKRRKESSPFTTEHIQSEIASTVLAVAKARATIPNFDANIFITNFDLPFRLDLCDEYGFITHEDQTAPAFEFEAESPYYATACLYFENLGNANGRVLALEDVGDIITNLNATTVRQALAALGVDFPDLGKASTSRRIFEAVTKAVP